VLVTLRIRAGMQREWRSRAGYPTHPGRTAHDWHLDVEDHLVLPRCPGADDRAGQLDDHAWPPRPKDRPWP
jgi:hypothetical protein